MILIMKDNLWTKIFLDKQFLKEVGATLALLFYTNLAKSNDTILQKVQLNMLSFFPKEDFSQNIWLLFKTSDDPIKPRWILEKINGIFLRKLSNAWTSRPKFISLFSYDQDKPYLKMFGEIWGTTKLPDVYQLLSPENTFNTGFVLFQAVRIWLQLLQN